MQRLRLNSSVSVVRTAGGLHLRKAVRTLRIGYQDLELLNSKVIPLLDGSRDWKSIVSSAAGRHRTAVLEFLKTLKKDGFLDIVSRVENGDAHPHLKEIVRCIGEYQKLSASWAHPLTGIFSYLETEPPDPANFRFVWTSRAVLRSAAPAHKSSLKQTGFGAGLSASEATTKAVAEALELYAAGNCSGDHLIKCPIISLTGDYLDPRVLIPYQRDQYEDREFPYQRFHSGRRIPWTRGRWLNTRKSVWLPAFLTYFSDNPLLNQSLAEVTTSGLAAGSNLVDASMRAICELLERDAFMITWMGRFPCRRLIRDATDEGFRTIVDAFAERGLEVRTYLLKAAIDIPVVLSLILGDGVNWPGATIALGAHPDPNVATRHSIIELAHMGPALRQQMLENNHEIPRASQVKTPLDHALYYFPKRRAQAFAFLDHGAPHLIRLSEIPPPKRIDLKFYRTRLAAAGIRVAIKDLTPRTVVSEKRFRVVRALGADLCPLQFGSEPSRPAVKRLRLAAQGGKRNPHPHPLG